jgi:hypothetical protein
MLLPGERFVLGDASTAVGLGCGRLALALSDRPGVRGGRDSRGLWVWCRKFSDTWVYFWVVARDRWPSKTWTLHSARSWG